MSSPEKLKMSCGTEFEAYVLRPENADKLFELINGVVIEKPVSTSYCSMIGATVGYFLVDFVRKSNIGGWLTGANGGYKIGDERYTPDVAYVSPEHDAESKKVYWFAKPPALIVEVLSPTEDLSNIPLKKEHYLNAGTVVWLIDPKTKTLEVHAPAQAVIVYSINDTLKGDPALPGFAIEMQKIFA